MSLTEVQRRVLEALRSEDGMTARQIARVVWPDDPSWDRVTSGRSASRHNGAMGATMPLRAGRVLRGLEDRRLVERDLSGLVRAGRWSITQTGRDSLLT